MIALYKAFLDELSAEQYEAEYSKQPEWKKKHIDSFGSSTDKKRTLAGLVLLRRGVKELFGKENYSVAANRNGKPVLPFCRFSISHSGNLAVCAFGENEIGVDAERLRQIKPREKYKLFDEREAAYVNAGGAELAHRFFEIWTKKEAYVKMIGGVLADVADVCTISDELKNISFHTDYFENYVISVCESTVLAL